MKVVTMEGIHQRLVGLQPHGGIVAPRTFRRCFSDAEYNLCQIQQGQAMESLTPGNVRTNYDIFRTLSSLAYICDFGL